MPVQADEHNLGFRLLLQDEFSRRCRINPRYSVRAFARQLDLDSSTLSQILSGKRNLSGKQIKKLSEKSGIRPPATADVPDFDLLALDSFSVISDWYHYAILDLTCLKSFKNNPKWIAAKLSISEPEARQAVERLIRLGMLKTAGGKLVKAKRFYTNYSEGVTSAAHREYQRQVIKKALEAIDGCGPKHLSRWLYWPRSDRSF